MKSITFLLALAMAVPVGMTAEQRAVPFPVSAVRLTSSPFKHAQEMDMQYLLSLNPDRLLAPYRRGAGLPPRADNYPNWENTGLDGHIGGHYLSALAYMYAATGNEEIRRRLDYMIKELKECQDHAGDGYLYGGPDGRRIWAEVKEGRIDAGRFNLNGGWVPLYNIHKIFNGLKDAYVVYGSNDAREMLVKLTDWFDTVTAALTDEQLQGMLQSEHGGLNEVFADVADITGNPHYLEMARRFSHREILDPLVAGEDKLTGFHANTQIPKVIGYKRIADLGGDPSWDDAADYFWHTVTGNRSVSIGGNSVYEHFHPADDFTAMMTSEQGPETCNTYNMLRLTRLLYATNPQPEYVDFYERALYNHILSTIDPVQGGFVYFTPMRPGHYRVYSQPQTSFWCCVGSGLENHARYGEMIYARSSDTLRVNMFIPSVLSAEEGRLEIVTDFPRSEMTRIAVTPTKEGGEFAIGVRVPGWAEGMSLSLNGKDVTPEVNDGLMTVRRKWHRGDTLTVTTPMHLEAEALPDGSAYRSFRYGPIVLAAGTGTERQDGLFADHSRGGHIAIGPKTPLHELPAIIADDGDYVGHLSPVEGKPLTFRLTGVTLPKFEWMVLEPFADIHESRYMVYFPVTTTEGWTATRDSLAAAEQARQRLESITLDHLTCGEQQPESDHFITMRATDTGNDGDLHWRAAKGHFGYRLDTRGEQPKRLRIAYRPDHDKGAVITLDGKEIARLEPGAREFRVIDIDIPFATSQTPEVVITPTATQTPHFYSLRLLKE